MMIRKTILLVDDEQMFIEGLADALEAEGHRVLKARSGAEALRILGGEAVDLVTVDVMMPFDEMGSGVTSDRGGIKVMEEIRQRWRDMDLLCISVVNDASTIARVNALGARFLRKGETSLEVVLRMIRSRLTGFAYRDPGQ